MLALAEPRIKAIYETNDQGRTPEPESRYDAEMAVYQGRKPHPEAAEDEVRPDQIQFRRQAVVRMVFDSNQNIPLSSLRPAKVIALDLMHPEMLPSPGVEWAFKNGGLFGSSPKAGGSSLRWVGGFNPFATYDLVIKNAQGDGLAGMTFLHSTNGNSLTAGLQFKAGKPEAITWNVVAGGKQVTEEKWPLPTGTAMKDWTCGALYLYHGHPAKP